MNNTGKTAIIILGVLAVICAAALAVLAMANKPVELSQDKMKETVEAAEKAKKESRGQDEAEEGYEGHAKAIAAFQVTSAGAGQAQGAAEGGAAAQEGAPASAGADYLCSYSSDRLMTEADVQELKQGTYEGLPQGMGIIRMVVNEIYAKNGYQFGNEAIQAYFDQKQWYQATPTRNAEMDSVIQEMTSTERANVEFLSPYIEE